MRSLKGGIEGEISVLVLDSLRLATAYNGDNFEAIALLHGRRLPMLAMQNFAIVFHGNQPRIQPYLLEKIRQQRPRRTRARLSIDMQIDHTLKLMCIRQSVAQTGSMYRNLVVSQLSSAF